MRKQPVVLHSMLLELWVQWLYPQWSSGPRVSSYDWPAGCVCLWLRVDGMQYEIQPNLEKFSHMAAPILIQVPL